jgi:hypothetical protein
MDRRQFVSGLGASAVASALPSAAYTQPACQAAAGTGCRIIDASIDVTRSAQLIADSGVATVIRFYTRLADFDQGPYQNTALTKKDELKALDDHKLTVATVFQYFSGGHGAGFHNPKKKLYDVRDALKNADTFNQPEGSTIYFGADFDLGLGDRKANITAIKDYFEHAHDEVSKTKRKIGVYGCGKTCEVLADEKWDMHYWISASTSYWRTAQFYNSGNWHLFQTRTELKRPYGGIDTNILNPKSTSFGQWRVSGGDVTEPSAVSQKILDARKFGIRPGMKLFSDPAHPDQSVVASGAIYGRSVRVLCEQGHAVGVSLDETDTLRGYCQASDLGPAVPLFGP